MTFRVNANSLKNAMGTVFLLAAAFFVCSTLVSIRSVFADPVVSNASVRNSGRQSPRATSKTTGRATVSRAATTRATTAGAKPATRTTVSRGSGANRTISARPVTPTRVTTASRGVSARNNTTTSRTNNNRAVRARSTSNVSRVSATGSIMSGSRASSQTSYSYLASKLYTGSYSNIIDSSTGLISADAYSNCMDAYYTCMDEICTARSDTKGRCSCAGRATNFLLAEEQLEEANEELIRLSGQLSLLIATKGKGDDLAAAFSLTEAEQVMNCVSWKEAEDKEEWYKQHPTFDASGNRISNTTSAPSYCTNNSYGFDIKDIDGSSSDVLAQLKAWADAKDLAKQFQEDETGVLTTRYKNISKIVNDLTAITEIDSSAAELDSMANKWGYKLFEYAHNNVCGRVLDSCFNGIYEACGTPVSVKDSDGKTHSRCANGATTSCPYNYNSYISVSDDGDVELHERDSNSSSSKSAEQTASCFGYTTTSSTTTTGTRKVSTSTSDPYYTLRGPVADARRSIMQKYLLDANAACDTYGAALKQTAQNINYQKIAAEQALQQKRLEFKQDADATALADATTAATNFDECLSELLDCYETQSDNTTSGGAKWTDARIKTYCAQISQVPHCYETMICNPSTAQFHAVIDLPDNSKCNNSQDYTQNTCRNIVTISEILNKVSGASDNPENIAAGATGSSVDMRERCLLDAGIEDLRTWSKERMINTACTMSQVRAKDENALAGYTTDSDAEKCEYITKCASGYMLNNNECILMAADCSYEIIGASVATRTVDANGKWSSCVLESCEDHYTMSGNTCVPVTEECYPSELRNVDSHATDGTRTYLGDGDWTTCEITGCMTGYILLDGSCQQNPRSCPDGDLTANYAIAGKQTYSDGEWGVCVFTACEEHYELVDGTCQPRE